jgi:hypothetical protein
LHRVPGCQADVFCFIAFIKIFVKGNPRPMNGSNLRP